MTGTEFTKRVADLTSAMIAYVDDEGRYQYMNRAYAEWLGGSASTYLGARHDASAGSNLSAIRSSIDGALAGHEQQLEVPVQRGDERQWVAVHVQPDRATDGAVIGCLCTLTDVTPRAQARALAAEKTRLLDILFTHNLDSVALLDTNYNFIRVSESYARVCDRPSAEFPGRNHFELYPSDAKNMFDAVVASNKPLTTFARPFRFPDHPEWGTTYWDWTLVPVSDDQGKVEFLVFTLRDVTKEKRAEIELAQHRDELLIRLEERTHEVELLHAELLRKERLAGLGQLLATVGHELRNPLGAVQASLELIELRLAGANDSVGKAMTRARRNIQRCHYIIEELLDYSRVQELRIEPTKFDEWLRSIMNEQPIPAHMTSELVLSAGGVAQLDRERIRRCVTNIVANAVDAMREQPGRQRLSVETRRRDHRLEIRVTDTGTGIAREQLERIFEPLYSTKIYGVGLGLPMVKQIMQRHGGGVDVDSTPGHGTTVTLWLPDPSQKEQTCSPC